MKDKNFEIQEMLDQRLRTGTTVPQELTESEDINVYEFIYSELAKEPEDGLPMSFKANVVREFQAQNKRKSDWLFYWIVVGISLFGILSVILTITFFWEAFSPLWLLIDRFKGLIAIALVGILAFKLLENRSFLSSSRS